MNRPRSIFVFLILALPFIPWTVYLGNITTGGSTQFYYELDFPMAAYVNFFGGVSGWIFYTPLQYLGVAIAVLGSTLISMSGTTRGRERMLRMGGFMSIAGPIIFTSSYSGIYETQQRIMNFVAFPAGSFVPIILGALALMLSVTQAPLIVPTGGPTSIPPLEGPSTQPPTVQPPTALEPELTFCPRCGYKLPEGVIYCPNCNFRVRR